MYICENCTKKFKYCGYGQRFCSRSCSTIFVLNKPKYKEIFRKQKLGKNNPNWKGDNVGVDALHEWIKKYIKKPKKCIICKKEKRLDLANISQKYKRDLSDWEWLCRKCHMTKDGRLKVFIKCSKERKNVKMSRM